MTYLEEYQKAIHDGNVVACYYLTKEVDNLVADMKNDRYIYDTKEAHRRFRFQEECCLQGKQAYFNKPIKLMLWQKAFWEALYSFKMRDTGKRRFLEALMLIARKNGKSTGAAADGNTDLFIGKGGESICCASNDDKQAKYIWTEIAGMRQRLDPTKAITGQNLTEIRNIPKNIIINRMSTKTQNKDGGNFTKTYQDEAHDVNEPNGNCEIYEACKKSMSAAEEPLFITLTTQGFSADGCFLDKKIERARKVIDGEIDDERLLPFLYEQDSEQEVWQDERSWEKSNPALPYGIKKLDLLRYEVEKSRTDKAQRIHTLCKDFNIKQNSAEQWLRAEDYTYKQERLTLEDFRGEMCLAGLDCSQTTDLTNLKLLFMRRGDDTKYCFSHYWIPETKLKDSDDKAAGARYEEWAQEGYITICPGSIVDLTDITRYIKKLRDQYGILVYKCGYDKSYAREFEQTIDRLSPNIKEPINQKQLSTPMKWAERDFQNHIINFGNNPVDTWCISNACCFVDGHENYSMRKTTAAKRIDGAITYLIVYATLMRFNSEYIDKIKKGN